MTILDEIVAYKRRRLEEQKRRLPLASLKERVTTVEPALDFPSALRANFIHISPFAGFE